MSIPVYITSIVRPRKLNVDPLYFFTIYLTSRNKAFIFALPVIENHGFCFVNIQSEFFLQVTNLGFGLILC